MGTFPEQFLWGAATSAYQVEGNNINSDWWEWEKRVDLRERSGCACRHYELFKEDFDLAKHLNHNAHRLSIEWSRIEPREGAFSQQEINHYKDVIQALRDRDIEPVVTLHHFTNPIWFANKGGWLDRKAYTYFVRYVEKIVDALCDMVRFWVTINEPMGWVYNSYFGGRWPPQKKSFLKHYMVANNLICTHVKAYQCIHMIYKKRNLPSPFVSIAKHFQVFEPCDGTVKNKIVAWLRDWLFNIRFIEKLIRAHSLDFLGVNYYSRTLVDVQRWSVRDLLLNVGQDSHQYLKKTTMGWEIYPQGFFNLLVRLAKYGLPLFILENGISTPDDNERWDYIYEHLRRLNRAMEQGVMVLGYLYWSLMDNFEWDSGFAHRFGLIEVDYQTYKRTIRESARKFAEVCKRGRI